MQRSLHEEMKELLKTFDILNGELSLVGHSFAFDFIVYLLYTNNFPCKTSSHVTCMGDK